MTFRAKTRTSQVNHTDAYRRIPKHPTARNTRHITRSSSTDRSICCRRIPPGEATSGNNTPETKPLPVEPGRGRHDGIVYTQRRRRRRIMRTMLGDHQNHVRILTRLLSELKRFVRILTKRGCSSRVRVWGMPKSVPQNSVEQITSSRVRVWVPPAFGEFSKTCTRPLLRENGRRGLHRSP